MYCENRDEDVERVDCNACDEDCSFAGIPFAKQHAGNPVEKPEPSEVEKLLREKLQQFFGGDLERVDKAISNFMPDLKSLVVSQAKILMSEAITKYIQDAVSGMIDGQLKSIFDTALAEKILLLKDGDNEPMVKTVQEMVCMKIKRFLETKDSYNERDLMKKRVDEVIASRVDGMIKPAIDELKKETIEKFTREMMKKMMQGMVKSIADDKKLLTAIDLD